jgi:hypothetical protein
MTMANPVDASRGQKFALVKPGLYTQSLSGNLSSTRRLSRLHGGIYAMLLSFIALLLVGASNLSFTPNAE